jgi:hypothetical protein
MLGKLCSTSFFLTSPITINPNPNPKFLMSDTHEQLRILKQVEREMEEKKKLLAEKWQGVQESKVALERAAEKRGTKPQD